MAKKSNVKIPGIVVLRTIVFLFIGFVLVFGYTKTYEFVTTSPLFSVKEVLVDTSIQFIDMPELKRLRGRNIFKVDILKLQARIRSQYPQISQLRVMRELPDRIKVLAKKREAIVQVNIKGKHLLIDGDAVAMYYAPQAQDLPFVNGVNVGKVVQGAPLASKPVKIVVAIIEKLKSQPHTSRIKLASIEAPSLSKIEIVSAAGPRIIVDQETYGPKLEILEMLLSQRKVDFRQIKYVDLRFSEPVLGENTPEE